jgi:hypothetical protein
LGWASDAGASYTVEYAPDLSFTTGVITSGPHSSTGGFIRVQVAIPALSSVKFFREIVDDGSTSPTLSLRPSEVELYWPSLPGKKYQVQSAEDAVTWTDEGTPITATDWTTTARFDIVTGVPRKSYRITCP